MEPTKDKLKIMIVDDLKLITSSMSLFLQDFYSVTALNDPIQALEIYKSQHPFHVVIVDMQMPQLSGAEFIKQIKTINQDQACIIMTGYTQKENIEQALQAGTLIRIFKKPFDLNDVLKTVQEIGKNPNAKEPENQ